MPRTYKNVAERLQQRRKAALEAILTNPAATPAEILQANAALARLDRQEAAKAPKPAPPVEDVPDEILIIIADPVNPPPAPIPARYSDPKPAPVKPAVPAWEPLIPEQTPHDIQASNSVSWATIFGMGATLSEDFKVSRRHWAEQAEREAEDRQRIRRQEQDKAARRQGQAWLPGQREEMP